MVRQWKVPSEVDTLLRKLIQGQEIPLDWKNDDKDTESFWRDHAIFSQYSHKVFTGNYKTYVQGMNLIAIELLYLNIVCRVQG